MQSGREKVKSKKAVVGYAEFMVFDTLQEACQELSEGRVLALVNKQYKTDAMNAVRAGASGEPSKKALSRMAMAAITIEEFQTVAGNEAALEALKERKMAEIKTRLAAEKATAGEAVPDEDADDDDEDEDD